MADKNKGMRETKDIKINFIKRDTSLSPEEALWRAVIIQAVLDSKIRSQKQKKKNFKTNALNWIFKEKIEFGNVCQMANVNSQKILDFFKKHEAPKANNKN